MRTAPWQHVTREQVETALEQFRGEIEQVPPVCVCVVYTVIHVHLQTDAGFPR